MYAASRQGRAGCGRRCRVRLGVVAALLMASSANGVAADRARGQRIAERWCTQCHVAASGQRLGSDAVPTFAQIGEAGRFDETTLAAFLTNPHASRMPDLSLTTSEIADLVAYIKSQVR